MEAAPPPSRDDSIMYLITCFRKRIKNNILVTRVLDLMPSLSHEVKDGIRAALRDKGNVEAAELLLRALEDVPHRPPGLCQEFQEALVQGGFAVASYVDPSLSELPSPSLEAASDVGAFLVQLFFPHLVKKLAAVQVADVCLQKNLFDDEDVERVGGAVRLERPSPAPRGRDNEGILAQVEFLRFAHTSLFQACTHNQNTTKIK